MLLILGNHLLFAMVCALLSGCFEEEILGLVYGFFSVGDEGFQLDMW